MWYGCSTHVPTWDVHITCYDETWSTQTCGGEPMQFSRGSTCVHTCKSEVIIERYCMSYIVHIFPIRSVRSYHCTSWMITSHHQNWRSGCMVSFWYNVCETLKLLLVDLAKSVVISIFRSAVCALCHWLVFCLILCFSLSVCLCLSHSEFS